MLPRLSLPTASVPTELQRSLKRILDAHPRKKLVEDGRVLYRHLLSRKGVTRVQESRRRRGLLRTVPVKLWSEKRTESKTKETVESVLRYGEREAVAYAASRLSAVYGSTLRVLNEIAVRDSEFRPETVLDFGSGLGTALWAAHQLWGDSLYEIQTVDVSREMGEMARQLRQAEEGERENEMETIPGVYFRQYLPTSDRVQYDVVMSCYTLGDLPSNNIKKLSLTALWKKTKKYLVLVEMGNDVGFRNILEARDTILHMSSSSSTEEGLRGHVFAPCPHSYSCPLVAAATDGDEGSPTVTMGGPCHFGQRVALDFSNEFVQGEQGHQLGRSPATHTTF